ncbi:PTS sugar transporter subunit IIA [Faecalicoccus pleomorphus]|uniref:BglG family transcription antiterminator n=1 Tax=Faecalicoccus pleomorphus TaxID=1323 RepID=UPI00232E3345|nr:PTS sugar transporter subunit IIA [Faecalicoccus pleomorphus]MDB7987751.1 PTS sugar transporter subunit IIA [Faecalicoccus pleomorphus]MDB7992204.1 PTS sugar transporter subunit IIA [Faecalicoccus pleomorphus]
MMTKRQYEILEHLLHHEGEFYSSKTLADLFGISVRTIKTDMKAIKQFSAKQNTFELQTLPSKGTRVVTENSEQAYMTIESSKKQMNQAIKKQQGDRTLTLIQLLLDSTGYVSKYTLFEKLYISESTLYKSIHEVREKLKKYKLSLVYKTNYGYKIEGREIDKRLCMIQNDMIYDNLSPYAISENLGRIYNIVADAFIRFKYQINEQSLQNITTHVALAVHRVKHGNVVEMQEDQDIMDRIEYKISENILNHFLPIYNISVTSFQNETILLTQTILGKGRYWQDNELRSDINEFINQAFILIHQKFSVNYETDETMKLYLALHLIPMFYRIRSRTQLENEMAPEIRQTFPLAYDIAIYFSILLSKHFDLDVSQDEVSFLALYFNYGLEKLNLVNFNKRVLILTTLRKSETVLLRHRILSWFPNQISEVTFADSNSDDYDIENYDAIFSTDDDMDKYKGGITKINIFPDEKDFDRINLAINGYTSIKSILDNFDKDCFFSGSLSSKSQVLKQLCDNASKKYELPDHFMETIEAREDISPTYFGNHIAVPHPLTPLSKDTFVSVAILDKPIRWDASHMVQLIMLVSVEKNNPKAFQIWHYLSNLVRNDDTLDMILKNPTYEAFIQSLTTSLKDAF